MKLQSLVHLLEATFSKWNTICRCTIVLHWSQSRSQSHETLPKSLGISLSLVYKSQSQSRSRKNNFQSLSLSLGLEKSNTKVSVSVSVSKNQIPKSQYQSQYQKSWSRRPLVGRCPIGKSRRQISHRRFSDQLFSINRSRFVDFKV